MSVLTEARKLIEDPAHWIQGWYAMNETRTSSLYPKDPAAACFCSIGAVVRILPGGALADRQVLALSTAVHEVDPDWWPSLDPGTVRMDRCIAQYNDTHTHEEVLAVWDHAIAEEAHTT